MRARSRRRILSPAPGRWSSTCNWHRHHPFHCWAPYAATRPHECLYGDHGIVRCLVLRGRDEDGVDAITKMASEFGLGQPAYDWTLDVGSEIRGLVPTPAWKRTQQRERNGGRVTPRSCRSAKSYLWSHLPADGLRGIATFADQGTATPPVCREANRNGGWSGGSRGPARCSRPTRRDARSKSKWCATPCSVPYRKSYGTAHGASVKGLSVAAE